MKILSNDHETNFTAIIKCDCGTAFEFVAEDMIVKGDYCTTYHVLCPTCKTDHNYTDNMLDNHKKEVDDYISSCCSCASCKYMAVTEEGYSSYTVTNISISCKMDNNIYMPLTGFEGRQEKNRYMPLQKSVGLLEVVFVTKKKLSSLKLMPLKNGKKIIIITQVINLLLIY